MAPGCWVAALPRSFDDNAIARSTVANSRANDPNRTFALPGYEANAPAGSTYFIVVQGVYPRRVE